MARRAEAVERYRKAAGMNLTDSWSHDQCGLRYELGPHAHERLTARFTRLENRTLE